MRYLAFIVIFLCSIQGFSQFSLGGSTWGCGFGNFESYSGLRLNFNDKDFSNAIYGMNIILISNKCRANTGFSWSLINAHVEQVNGVSISFYNDNFIVNGVQWGIVNQTISGFNGFQMGFLNQIEGHGYTKSGRLRGVQVGIWNKAILNTGLQFGFANISILNGSIDPFNNDRFKRLKNIFSGVQMGFVNYTNTGQGLQLGLINVRKINTERTTVLPFISFRIRKSGEDERFTTGSFNEDKPKGKFLQKLINRHRKSFWEDGPDRKDRKNGAPKKTFIDDGPKKEKKKRGKIKSKEKKQNKKAAE